MPNYVTNVLTQEDSKGSSFLYFELFLRKEKPLTQ